VIKVNKAQEEIRVSKENRVPVYRVHRVTKDRKETQANLVHKDQEDTRADGSIQAQIQTGEDLRDQLDRLDLRDTRDQEDLKVYKRI